MRPITVEELIVNGAPTPVAYDGVISNRNTERNGDNNLTCPYGTGGKFIMHNPGAFGGKSPFPVWPLWPTDPPSCSPPLPTWDPPSPYGP